MTTIEANPFDRSPVETYLDAPSARDFINALGRVYLDAGLPLALAFEAALADYQDFGVPFACAT
jgi:hypothetical protein